MSVIMIGLASCGNGGHSKAFNESKKVLDNVKSEIQSAKDCDEVDMATFGILGLLGVEGVDEMPDAEQEELTKLTEEIDKVLEAKKAELKELTKAKTEAEKIAAEKKAEEDKAKLMEAIAASGKSVDEIISLLNVQQ